MDMQGQTETPKTPIHLSSLGDPTLGAAGSEGPRCKSLGCELDTQLRQSTVGKPWSTCAGGPYGNKFYAASNVRAFVASRRRRLGA